MRAWLKRHRFTRELHDHFASYRWNNWASWDDEEKDWASSL